MKGMRCTDMLKTKSKIFVITIIILLIAAASIYTYYRMDVFGDGFQGEETYTFKIRKTVDTDRTELYKYIVISINKNESTIEVTQPEIPYKRKRKLSEEEVKSFHAFIQKRQIDSLVSYDYDNPWLEYYYEHIKDGGTNRVRFDNSVIKEFNIYGSLINQFLNLTNTGDFEVINITWEDLLAEFPGEKVKVNSVLYDGPYESKTYVSDMKWASQKYTKKKAKIFTIKAGLEKIKYIKVVPDSVITINLNGKYDMFTSYILWDVGSAVSKVRIKVIADEEEVYDSGVLSAGGATNNSVIVDVRGKNTSRLELYGVKEPRFAECTWKDSILYKGTNTESTPYDKTGSPS